MFRTSAVPLVAACPDVDPSPMEAKKVFWLGNHASQRAWGAPVSKVHSTGGLQLLKSLGWDQVPNDHPELPVFAFTTRKGANYPANQPGLPPVRQFPHQNTACLDDKRSMQQHLSQHAGPAHMLPLSWPSIGDYITWLQQHHMQQTQQANANPQPCFSTAAAVTAAPRRPSTPAGPSSCIAADASSATSGPSTKDAETNSSSSSGQPGDSQTQLPGTVFVKHRRGVKGQAVYVAQTVADLQQLQEKLKGSLADFVVQQEVAPPMLLEGRKFVLRVHVLIVLRQGTGSCAAAMQAAAQVMQAGMGGQQLEGSSDEAAVGEPLCAGVAVTQRGAAADDSRLDVYVHEDVVVLPHASLYDASSKEPAAHISSKGSNHPPPVLLQQLPELHALVWPQLLQLAAATIEAASPALIPVEVAPDAALYHLFGFDCMLDASGHAVLLEVNSYPAVTSGTMSAVPTHVYTRLVQDMVTLLVLPRTDGAAESAGGFMLCS